MYESTRAYTTFDKLYNITLCVSYCVLLQFVFKPLTVNVTSNCLNVLHYKKTQQHYVNLLSFTKQSDKTVHSIQLDNV